MQFIVRENNEIWYKSTLAHALDRRKVSLGEPQADDLPETVNPLELLKALTGSHLIVARVPDSAVGVFQALPILQCLVPAGKRLLIIRELAPTEDTMEFQIEENVECTDAYVCTDQYKGAVG